MEVQLHGVASFMFQLDKDEEKAGEEGELLGEVACSHEKRRKASWLATETAETGAAAAAARRPRKKKERMKRGGGGGGESKNEEKL